VVGGSWLVVRTKLRRTLTRTLVSQGARELIARDPDLARIHRRIGDPPIWGRRPGFPALVKIILEQQVSLRSAAAMYRRIDGHVGGLSPQAIDGLGVAGLRRLGVTRQKAAYCHGLACQIMDGTLDLPAIARAPDDEGRQSLLGVKGLGPWSVDIYYLMALRRPDVWPRGDLALAVALRDVKKLPALPTFEQQQKLAQAWAPWRSVAARILWAHYLTERGLPI
jgi:DNA-3-methyladenine glycosylase II